ncbi:PREDICTED: nuclear autoantigenic sperm protein [Nelumbo nucifera]|uniref:Nuclear autoantigenic sperm protein n=1 Tax=Nelumbo nucifera TaxID=4432 RepID=A0A1U8A8X6_NELNU|nr:PREDICTED: nuclear autoantigenic sperm protein [Nelumbo nucifera]
MTEEALRKEPEIKSMEAEDNLAAKNDETPAEPQEAPIDEGSKESSSGKEDSCPPQDSDKTLEYALELMERGSEAVKEGDYAEAAECFSRAVEIRVAHYGELAPECATAYYKYGCALLYKAQEESDPLATVPKKEVDSQQNSSRNGVAKDAKSSECSSSSVNDAKQDRDSNHNEGDPDDGATEKDQGEDDAESEDEDLAEADEDESDLDLAWKMLDVARAIAEKQLGDTMEKVDILSALGEVSLEREDIETSISDYLKALSILERLVEPDNRQIAELNFRICLCLEVGSKVQEAIPYCQKAIKVCKARVERLMDEVKSLKGTEMTMVSDMNQMDQLSSSGSHSDSFVSDKEAEIETLNGLSGELEKKLEDLQQQASNPTSLFSEILKMASAKATSSLKSSAVMGSSQLGTSNSGGGFDSPTVSTAHTNGAGPVGGVTHLGVVGRGVKRASVNSSSVEASAMKKASLDSSGDKDESTVS